MACATLPTTSTTARVPARRVVLISFDAGADWIVDRLIAAGKAPAFAALAREGAQADAMISVIPSLTAVAHASLWTGAFPGPTAPPTTTCRWRRPPRTRWSNDARGT